MPKVSKKLERKLREIFRDKLAQGKADLETLPNGHVCGHVISSEFKNRDYEERRQRIDKVLDQCVKHKLLTAGERSRISTLLTYTPAEWSAVTANLENE